MKSLFALRGHTVFGAPLSVQPYPKTKTIELKGLWHSAVAFLFFELNQLTEAFFPLFAKRVPDEAYVIQSSPLVRGQAVHPAPLTSNPEAKFETFQFETMRNSAVAFLFFELNQLAETSFPVFDNTIPNEAYVIQSTPLVRRRIRPLVNSAILHDNKSNKESVLYYVGGWSELRRIRPSLNLTKKRQGKLIFCLGNLGRKRANPIRLVMNPRGPISLTESLVQAR